MLVKEVQRVEENVNRQRRMVTVYDWLHVKDHMH